MHDTTVVPDAGRVMIIKEPKDAGALSRRMPEDPFKGQYGDGIIEPPYDISFMAGLPETSNILLQCIEAMETNVDGFGFMLEPLNAADDDISPEAEAERQRLLHFFEFCNPELPYTQIRRRTRRDLETIGNGYWEIIRDGKGGIAWIEHVEGHTMRLCSLDREYTPVNIRVIEDGEYASYEHRKRFRRFVQIRDGQRVYFKEFGDPRNIDARTGRVYGDDDATGGGFIPATEIIHFRLYCPHSPYGVPRWMGNLLAVMGSRQAEEVNFEYFENNTIPQMALLVAGRLADSAVEQIRDFLRDHMRGRKGFNKILVIEAAPAGAAIPGQTQQQPSIQFVPLSDAQQKDALFDNYDRTNREKIRSSFRIPPIFVGLTSDYTRATARESRAVAEEQVFAPERAEHDFVINRLIFPDMGVKHWRYRSLAPEVRDADSMTSMLDVLCRCGLTVREARAEMAKLLNMTLADFNSEEEGAEWLDLPLSVYLAKLQAGQIGAEAEQPADVQKAQRAGAANNANEGRLLDALADIEAALSVDTCHDEHHDHTGGAA